MNDDERAELEHSLKTPLAVIAGYAELLARNDDEETRVTAAHQIGAAAHRLTLAVDTMLGLDGGAPPSGPTAPAPGWRSSRPARVIVIDDDVFVRRLLRMTLPAEDFEIAEAADGDTALALADVQQPDLVVLDWLMPNVPGEAVLTELKRRQPGVAVVVLTVDGEQRTRAIELGADAFLTKPFSPLELLRTVERLLADPARNLGSG